MNANLQFELNLWQSVSRHLDIGESIEAIATSLTNHVQLRSLSICRLDSEQRIVRSAGGWPVNSSDQVASEVPVSEPDWRRLDRWVRQSKQSHKAEDEKSALSSLIGILKPVHITEDFVLAPLNGEHGSARCPNSHRLG